MEKVTADNLTAAAVKDIIETSQKTGRKIRLTGYLTSKGQIFDYTLEPCEYLELVESSLSKLDDTVRPDTVDKESWMAALEELRVSLEKSLEGQHKQKTMTRELNSVSDHVSVDAQAADMVVLRNMRALATVKVGGPDTPEAKSKTPVIAAKKLIEAQLPRSQYVGQLNLNRGKFTSLEIL